MKNTQEQLNEFICADHKKDYVEEKNTNKIQSHNYSELLIINKGDIIYAARGKVVRLGDRSVIYNRRDTIHNNYVQHSRLYERYRIKFREEELLNGEEGEVLRAALSSSFTKELTDESFTMIYELAKSIFNESSKPQITELDKSIIRTALKLIVLSAASADDKGSLHGESYISEVLKYINGNLHQKLTIGSIAEAFFVSKGKLIYDFKTYCNMNISEYITMERLEKAKELLMSGCPVAEIAENCGFSSSSYFIKVFSSVVGTTPLKYRTNHFKPGAGTKE